MFYQQSLLQEFFTCKTCEQTFSESNQPQTLKCGLTICNECVDQKDSDGECNCKICSTIHKISRDDLFTNETVLKLMKLNTITDL